MEFSKEEFVPVIRCSICTGEQVAGFKNRKTGKFLECFAINSGRDLKAFCKEYGIDETDILKEY